MSNYPDGFSLDRYEAQYEPYSDRNDAIDAWLANIDTFVSATISGVHSLAKSCPEIEQIVPYSFQRDDDRLKEGLEETIHEYLYGFIQACNNNREE